MSKTFKEIKAEQFEVYAKKQDERYEKLVLLKEEYDEKSFLPKQWIKAYEIFKKEKFKCWRKMPYVVKKLKLAAKLAARNIMKNYKIYVSQARIDRDNKVKKDIINNTSDYES